MTQPWDPNEDIADACRRLSNSPSVLISLEARSVLHRAAEAIEELRGDDPERMAA